MLLGSMHAFMRSLFCFMIFITSPRDQIAAAVECVVGGCKSVGREATGRWVGADGVCKKGRRAEYLALSYHTRKKRRSLCVAGKFNSTLENVFS